MSAPCFPSFSTRASLLFWHPPLATCGSRIPRPLGLPLSALLSPESFLGRTGNRGAEGLLSLLLFQAHACSMFSGSHHTLYSSRERWPLSPISLPALWYCLCC